MRTARILGEDASCYHCVSRVVDRRTIMTAEEQEKFFRIMRKVEGFCGVEILTYAVLGNHFHLLTEVPERKEISDKELIRRMGLLYDKIFVKEYARLLKECRQNGDHDSAERMKRKYTYRMYDLGEFMKTLKQRYTMSYNGRHGRKGTLWEERFKSVLLEKPKSRKISREWTAVALAAAYIDLNAVRAGIVKDPKDYRYCGYGEAVGGSKQARAGLLKVMRSIGSGGSWREAAQAYRKLIYLRGEKTEAKAGFSSEVVDKVIESGGKLSTAEVVRCRVRYFSDGMVLGSKDFVDSVFRKNRKLFGARRKDGARKLKYAEWGGLCAMRDLRLRPISASGG